MRIYWSGEAKNIIGEKIRALRLQRSMTQKALAEQLQLAGYEFSDLTILRIENGTRFVPDYELKFFSRALSFSLLPSSTPRACWAWLILW